MVGVCLEGSQREEFSMARSASYLLLRLAQAGASLKVIQEAAGHKTIAMSARYAHMDHTTLHNAMSVLNRPKSAQPSD